MLRPLAILFSCGVLAAQTGAAPGGDPRWLALRFLEGTWAAKTKNTNAAGANVSGSYSFRKELGGHILARHSNTDGCKGPIDCDHGDLLYVYEDAPGQPLKAIYFDNEGHVIHYTVSSPSPGAALFLSEPAGDGPRFRLIYELKSGVLQGKFQMLPPGKSEWTSYLEWSGGRQ